MALRALSSRTILIPLSLMALPTAYYLSPYSLPAPLHTTNELPPSLKAEPILRLVNPRNYKGIQDSIEITLPLSVINGKEIAQDDEIILARFVKGFFGGWTFTPERIGLTYLVKSLTDFSFKPKSQILWKASDLSPSKLPQIGTSIVDGFVVLESEIQPNTTKSTKDSSYITFGFGKDEGTFSGLHRITLTRNRTEENNNKGNGNDDQQEETVTITYGSMACNPAVNKGIVFPGLWYLHKAYGWALFKEGAWRVVHG